VVIVPQFGLHRTSYGSLKWLSLISLFLGNIILKSMQDLFITTFMNVISNRYAKFDFFLICFKFWQIY